MGTRLPSRLSHAWLDCETLGRPPILALTATATQEVQDDIVRQLGMHDPHVTITGFARPNLRFEVRRTVNDGIKDAIVEQILNETEARA